MSTLSKWLKKAEKAISNVIPHQHSADRRAANAAMAEQISFYKEQKDMMTKEATRLESERDSEKKKIAQRQIKSMRRAYRAPGFMDSAGNELSDTLG